MNLEMQDNNGIVTGIYSDNDSFYAVGIDFGVVASVAFEHKADVSEISLREFIDQVKIKTDRDHTFVYCIDSWPIVFHTIEVPNVASKQLDQIVKMQLDSILPTTDQGFDIVWQKFSTSSNGVIVNTATITKEISRDLVSQISEAGIDKTCLCAEAEVLLSGKLANLECERYIQISFFRDCVWIYAVEKSKLISAWVVELAPFANAYLHVMREIEEVINDFQEKVSGFNEVLLSNYTDSDIGVYAESIERKGMSVTILSSDQKFDDMSKSSFKDHGFARAAGAALAVHFSQEDTLNPIGSLSGSAEDADKSRIDKKLFNGGLLLVGCLVFMFLLIYSGKRIYLWQLESLAAKEDIAVMLSEHQQRKNIVKYRIDMVDLLGRITKGLSKEITIDSFNFSRAKKVILRVKSKDVKNIYAFQKKLSDDHSFKHVRIQNQSKDKKTKMNKCTISFEYKYFSKKRLR